MSRYIHLKQECTHYQRVDYDTVNTSRWPEHLKNHRPVITLQEHYVVTSSGNAKIKQIIVQYVLSLPGDNQTTMSRFRNLPKYSFWAVILVLTPNILSAIGLDFLWIAKFQDIVRRVFTIWPAWLIFCLLLTALSYTVVKHPKSYGQSKKPLKNSPHNELQG